MRPHRFALTELTWNFEALRNFLNFEVLQQAAATLELYEGLVYTQEPSRTAQLGENLNERTGLEWLPRRAQEERVRFNPEGSVFRNKARVFTSMGILDPEALREAKTVKLTNFGKALGQGLLTRDQFYESIITGFRYPHPAYPDGGRRWREASTSVRPFVLIIEVLVELVRIDPDQNYLSSGEFVDWVASQSSGFDAKSAAKGIQEARESSAESQTSAAREARRNATDLFGFLCITGFTYFLGPGTISLNLVSVSDKDKTHFWLKNSNGESSLDRIEAILERGNE